MSNEASTIPTPEMTKDTNKLPHGMMIGPDGKPCKICTAFRHMRTNKQSVTKKAPTAAQVAALATETSGTSLAEDTPSDQPSPCCPPDVEVLGRSTWTFLHTTAAYYPEKPTPTQRANMLSLIRSLPLLYPCTNCALDFGEDIKANPPDVSGRRGLSQWLCERHNEVNMKLGKERFDCSIASTDVRWKDGPTDGSCD